MPSVNVLEADLAVVVVVDLQEKMLAALNGSTREQIVEKTCKLLDAARILSLPILFTEQNPRGLGPTDARVKGRLPTDLTPIVKTTCSCWRDETFRARLQRTDREHVILIGMETHVCIQQTALDLIRVDYVPFIAADAVSSRHEQDMCVAFDRMRHEGATISTAEALIFELVERCDHPRFKDILKIIK